MNETKLFHSEVFMPDHLIELVRKINSRIDNVRFSYHLKSQSRDNDDKKHAMSLFVLDNVIKSSKDEEINPFEIELFHVEEKRWRVTKYVFRHSYDETRDVVIVIAPTINGDHCDWKNVVVKTAWLNNKDDVHATLDEKRYAKEL